MLYNKYVLTVPNSVFKFMYNFVNRIRLAMEVMFKFRTRTMCDLSVYICDKYILNIYKIKII